MRLRHLLPADLAAVLAAPASGEPDTYGVRCLDVGGSVLMAVERIPGTSWLAVAGAGGENRTQLKPGEAGAVPQDALWSDPERGGGRYVILTLADARGHAYDARAWIPDGGGAAILDVEVDGLSAPDFRPPDWMAGLVPIAPDDAFRHLARGTGDPPADAGPEAVAALRDLMAPKRQQTLALTFMAELAELPPLDPFDEIRDAARDLAMSLSRDKAGVRTALMPFGSPGAAWPPEGVSEFEAGVHRDLGCFVLRLKGGGVTLGIDRGDAAGLVLGPDVGPPALLDGAAASALAGGGEAEVDGRRVRLWKACAPGEVEMLLVGIHPRELNR